MLEKLLIYLLNKPQVKAALKEIMLESQVVNIPTRKNALQIHEELVEKLRCDNRLYQEVLDDWRKNPSSFSPHHKFSYALQRAALSLYAQLNENKLYDNH